MARLGSQRSRWLARTWPLLVVAGVLELLLVARHFGVRFVERALRRMQRSGDRLAIVLDSERNERGLVTLQDILQVIFGEVTL